MSDYFAVATTTVPTINQKTLRKQHARVRSDLRAMAERAHSVGMDFMAIHPSDVNWGKNELRAWVPASEGRVEDPWVVRTVPIPDVVYENVFVHLALKGVARALRVLCRKRKIPLFNPLTSGKEKVTAVLQASPRTAALIPATDVVQSPDDVLKYCDEYRTVYLKPSDGSGGNGVMRLERVQRLGSTMIRMKADRHELGPFERIVSEREMRRWLGRHVRPKTHLVQQGLQLPHVQGGQVDFRVVVQRDREGQWQLIGIVPKVASPNGVVTNVIAGGHIETLDHLLSQPELRGLIQPEALAAEAITLAQTYAARRPTFGIAGFDMGIDVDGRTWMIEMNPKPARTLLTTPMKRKSFILCTDFAKYLSKKR